MSLSVRSSVVLPPLPIDGIRREFCALLSKHSRLILEAPTGSGKSSRVPLWLLETPSLCPGKILLLEPRRVAARALARHLAHLLGEEVGQQVGLRMRGESIGPSSTKLDVVTEGVLTRLIVSDPTLSAVSCLIFDEVHERSLNSDLGLALACDIQEGLREDLRLILMSATLAGGETEALHCPKLSTEVRAYPVEIVHLPPADAHRPGLAGFYAHMAKIILFYAQRERGTLLAFLPGRGEIARMRELLTMSSPSFELFSLTRDTAQEVQDEILKSVPGSFRVVLSTSVAESALTIPDVRVVVDSGLSRFVRFDPVCGVERLVTERTPLASLRQRAGRAGRTGPGLCVRLWSEGEEKERMARAPAEMLRADLSGPVLNLASLGIVSFEQAQSLVWLDPLPKKSFDLARAKLMELGLLDSCGVPTSLGRTVAKLPLSPRTAISLVAGSKVPEKAALLSAILENKERLVRREVDLEEVLDALLSREAGSKGLLEEALRIHRLSGGKKSVRDFLKAASAPCNLAEILLPAWSDFFAVRVGVTEGSDDVGYQLASGRMLRLASSLPLSRANYLIAPHILGGTGVARIRLALAVPNALAEKFLAERAETRREITVTDDGRLIVFAVKSLGAIVLERQPLPPPDPSVVRHHLVRHLRQKGLGLLPWSEDARGFQSRVLFLHRVFGDVFPDLNDAALLDNLDLWLGPLLEAPDALKTMNAKALLAALKSLLDFQRLQRLEQEAPVFWISPSGHRHRLHYEDENPWLECRLQEVFGTRENPRIAGGRVPLTLRLTSPAGRPLQITADLAHFWANSYRQVRAEMLGRYPRHPWPEDPLTAIPTRSAKKAQTKR